MLRCKVNGRSLGLRPFPYSDFWLVFVWMTFFVLCLLALLVLLAGLRLDCVVVPVVFDGLTDVVLVLIDLLMLLAGETTTIGGAIVGCLSIDAGITTFYVASFAGSHLT